MSHFVRTFLSKLAALALLAGVIFLITSGLIMPTFERLQNLAERIAAQRSLLGRYIANTTSAGGKAIEPAFAVPMYLPGETDSVRLASLQSTLNDAAKLQNVRLSSTRALEAGEQNGVRLLGLQTQLSSELAALQAILFDLEKKRPNLMIDGLHIVKSPDTGAARSGGLNVTFTVLGTAPEKKD